MRENIESVTEFVIAVEAILEALGYKILSYPGPRDSGGDWIVEKDNEITLIEAKYLINPVPASIKSSLKSGQQTLERAASFHQAVSQFVLVTNFNVPRKDVKLYQELYSVIIWDLKYLSKCVNDNKSLKSKYSNFISRLKDISKRSVTRVEETQEYLILKNRLETLAPGRATWREYEDVCIDILNYVFNPPFLLPPAIQNASRDGLHRRDAIYQLDVGNPVWDRIQSHFRTRFVVAEFKNYTDNLGQDELEAICKYLIPKHLRSLGFLCGRQEPNNNAITRRESVWTHQDKLVIFLSDNDMMSLLELKASDNDPAQYIDDKINAFLMVTN